MEQHQERDAQILSGIAAQMRQIMATMYLASRQLVPEEARDQDPTLDRKAAVLDQSYFQLLRIVNEMAASEYFASDDPLPLGDVDVTELFERLCQECESLIRLQPLTFTFSHKGLPPACALHPAGFELILYHLISNAIKFTPRGGSITVELTVDERRSHLLLLVTDTGCGIPPERMEHLFDHYLHASPQPRPYGVGLGLPLSRQIAHRMGGTLVAQSDARLGTRFTLSIPLRTLGRKLSDVRPPYDSGFNPTLTGLADALPPDAFMIRMQK